MQAANAYVGTSQPRALASKAHGYDILSAIQVGQEMCLYKEYGSADHESIHAIRSQQALKKADAPVKEERQWKAKLRLSRLRLSVHLSRQQPFCPCTGRIL